MSRLAAPAVILILARLVTSSSSSIRTSAFQFVRASSLSSTSDSSPLLSRHRVVRRITSPTSLLLLKMSSSSSSSAPWKPGDTEQANEARALDIWPLDEYNAELLNAVHPRGYDKSVTEPHEVYDLIAIGAGAGGLVSSRQVSPKRKKNYSRDGMLVARLLEEWFQLLLLGFLVLQSKRIYPFSQLQLFRKKLHPPPLSLFICTSSSRLDGVPRVP
jgi:hypothetical protein